MRILLSFLQGRPGHPIPSYGFWREYLINGLQEAGHECLEVPGADWAEALVYDDEDRLQKWRSQNWDLTISFVRRELLKGPIHLFLSYFYPQHVDETAISQLQRWGVPCVNFYCDNVREFQRVPEAFYCFDLHWVPEYEALPMYAAADLRHIHLPMPCWVPDAYRCTPEQEHDKAVFVGSADSHRRELLADAVRCGADVEIYGSSWTDDEITLGGPIDLPAKISNQLEFLRRNGMQAFVRKVRRKVRSKRVSELPKGLVHGPVTAGKYFSTLREARVTIGINRLPSISSPKAAKYSRLRDIEGPMLGACYLTEWTEGLTHLYDLGREIETYNTGAELAAKLIELSRNDCKRKHMRLAAQKRALREHSIQASIVRICSSIGI
jgi:hypothetical protein